MSELLINISKLSLGHHARSLEAQPGDVGLDSRFTQPIRVEAALEKSTRQLYMRVRITTGALFTCDRCLGEFPREVTAGYAIVYVMGEQSAERPIGGEEIQMITPDTNVIDLGEDVRQFTLLALPQKSLCRDECEGLCPTCGVNKNRSSCSCHEEEVDPRWAALKQIQKN